MIYGKNYERFDIFQHNHEHNHKRLVFLYLNNPKTLAEYAAGGVVQVVCVMMTIR